MASRNSRFVMPGGAGITILSKEEMAKIEDRRRARKDVEEAKKEKNLQDDS